MKFIKNLIFSPISDFCKHISNAIIYLFVFVDVLLLIASASFSVWGKSLSGVFACLKLVPEPIFIIVGVFGGFISGFFLAKLLPEISNVHKDRVKELRDSCDKYSKKIEEITNERNALATCLEDAKNEIGRLQHQRIDITSFKEVLQVVLAQADMRVKDIKCEWLKKEFVPKSHMHRARIKRYVGALEQEFTAKLWVDLFKDVKIHVGDKILYVTGIVPKVDACNSKPTKWLIREIQSYKLKEIGQKNDSPDAFDIIGDDGRTARYEPDAEAPIETSVDPHDFLSSSERHTNELLDRIRETNFDGYKMVLDCVKSAAERFIRMLLKPCEKDGYRIEFPSEDAVAGIAPVPLEDFVTAFNSQQGRPNELPALSNDVVM